MVSLRAAGMSHWAGQQLARGVCGIDGARGPPGVCRKGTSWYLGRNLLPLPAPQLTAPLPQPSSIPGCAPTTPFCSTHEFKYTSFHETNAAARAAADAAVNLAAAERAEREAERAEKAAAERNKAKGSGPTGPSVAQRLKQGMERVGEAAAAEAMGASDIAALSSERRMRAALRAKEERQRPPGVLYLNERDAQVGADWALASAECLCT